RLRWPIRALFDEVLAGLRQLVAEHPQVESVGIDTWGVDYALLDSEGGLLAEPTSYRDERTAAAVDAVHRRISRSELFATNGLQFLPFNTIYQLEDERHGALWADTASLVLLPDLLGFWLTGVLRTERTNASTTGLLDVHSGEWSQALLDDLGVSADMLAPLVSPGAVLGPVLPALRERLGGAPDLVVTTVGSHDTASAVAGVPAAGTRFAYVATGTWSLIGVELERPMLTPAARDGNFSNERGVDDSICFLRNSAGFWLVQESLRTWAARGDAHELGQLLADAADAPGGALIDVDDPALAVPGPMPELIAAAASGTGQHAPATPAETVRCVLDSLADAYAKTVRKTAALSGVPVDVIHLVGGGAQTPLLGQATADAAGLPVTAGPVEATAWGNVTVQARAHGALPGSLRETRAMVARHTDLRTYEPR
ncbi:MAG TPA: FGGY-family carbohydrate kinase, partial [Acidimicrobiales bacterium]|nr:FGGY-family carbohydrate kinase [Acidimicrobiales bacterium]